MSFTALGEKDHMRLVIPSDSLKSLTTILGLNLYSVAASASQLGIREELRWLPGLMKTSLIPLSCAQERTGRSSLYGAVTTSQKVPLFFMAAVHFLC